MPFDPEKPQLSLKEALFDRGQDERSHAIEDVDGRGMSYGQLRSHARKVVGMLNGAGFGRGDRIATVFSNGAEQLATLVTLMTGFTVVPVNPALGEEEVTRYLSDAHVKAIVLEGNLACPASKVAERLGLTVLELVKGRAGDELTFSLKGIPEGTDGVSEPDYAREDDLIAVFGTSGTTSKPKLVPLKHSNTLWAQYFYQKNHGVSPSDRFLSFLPLFYSHGLLTTLRTLCFGGCIVCAPRFDPMLFYQWLDSSKATWITAGPTTYQAILEHAKEHADIIARNRLRYISTGNAAMPPRVMDELERIFGVPVLETYAMTEVNIITIVPQAARKPKRGSAGVSWGTEVAIMDEDGSLLPDGKIGEIVV